MENDHKQFGIYHHRRQYRKSEGLCSRKSSKQSYIYVPCPKIGIPNSTCFLRYYNLFSFDLDDYPQINAETCQHNEPINKQYTQKRTRVWFYPKYMENTVAGEQVNYHKVFKRAHNICSWSYLCKKHFRIFYDTEQYIELNPLSV